jgi:hypothetical protein
VKPLPFEVKVPMVAIVVSFQLPAAPIATSMAGDTPEVLWTRTLKPARKGQPGTTPCLREEWTRSGQGKKSSPAAGKSVAQRRRPALNIQPRTTWVCQTAEEHELAIIETQPKTGPITALFAHIWQPSGALR